VLVKLIQLRQNQCASALIAGGRGRGCQRSQSFDVDTDQLNLKNGFVQHTGAEIAEFLERYFAL